MAGGEGTRLRPLTTTRPKPMVLVANRPILEHVINLLKDNGVDEVVITLQYLPEVVKNYFGDGSQFGMKITYSVEEKPLGTAGSVKKVEKNLKDTFLVISGDLVTDINLRDAVKFHKERGAVATIVLTRVSNPIEYGIVTTDSNGRVKQFLEKPSWGEVFSDTINAGIYILEPEVLERIKPDEPFDFSKQLFPLLLKEKEPLFGYIADGYWCDIGNPQQYAEANRDALSGKLRVKIPGKQIGEKVWVDEKTVLEKGAKISGPVLIGKNCRIRAEARICDSIIGDNVTVDRNTSVERSVVWHNNFISSSADLAGCVICERCEVKAGAVILENAIVGDDCSIGQGSVIRPMVKIWPNKMIEAGSIVTVDVRWGIRWLKNLFGSWGITALANIEITPEFAAKLGAAFGSYLPKGARVAVSRDTHNISRMIKRALISGLNSVGTDVFNLRIAPTPLTRFSVKKLGANAGISVKISHVDPNSVNLQFFNADGINIDKRSEKKIEELFFKEDFRRVYVDEIGEIVYPANTPGFYVDSILGSVNRESIESAKISIVVDCNNGSASAVTPAIFHALGCKVTTLNARMEETAGPVPLEDMPQILSTLSKVVKATGSDIGIALDSGADRALLVDENGGIISGDLALASLVKAVLEEKRGGKVVVPVTASRAVDGIADSYGGTAIRTGVGAHPLLETIMKEKAVFGGNESGGFVFPEFLVGYDGIVTAVKLVEMMAEREIALSTLVRDIPSFYMIKERVRCPWESRGKVMRTLINETRDQQVDLIDGVKILSDDGWILLLPKTEEPIFELYAEARSEEEANSLVQAYMEKIRVLAT